MGVFYAILYVMAIDVVVTRDPIMRAVVMSNRCWTMRWGDTDPLNARTAYSDVSTNIIHTSSRAENLNHGCD